MKNTNKHPLDYPYSLDFKDIFKSTGKDKDEEVAKVIFDNFRFLSGLSQDFLERHTRLLKEKDIPEDDTFAVRSILEIEREWNLWCDSKNIEKNELERFIFFLPKEISSFYEFYHGELSNVLNFFEDLILFLNNKNKISVFINTQDRERFLLTSKSEKIKNLKQNVMNNLLQSCEDKIYQNKTAKAWFLDNIHSFPEL